MERTRDPSHAACMPRYTAASAHVNPGRPSRARLALATAGAALGHGLAYSVAFIALGAIAVFRGLEHGWLAPFRIGNVEVPKFMGALATNVTVAVLCGTAVVAVVVAFTIRYLTFRSFRARAGPRRHRHRRRRQAGRVHRPLPR